MIGQLCAVRPRHPDAPPPAVRSWPTQAGGARRRTPRFGGAIRAALLVVGMLMVLVAGRARADCTSRGTPTWSTVAFTPPATITVPNNLPAGTQTVLWTSSPVAPSVTYSWDCNGNTDSGVVNYIAGQPTGDDTLFPTYVPNLYYRLLHPDASTPLRAYPNYPVSNGNNIPFSVATALQLVAMGPITNGSTLAAGQLAQWKVDFRRYGSVPVEIFQTNASTRFIGPACSVAVDPTVVVLPTVFTANFGGVGSTTGQTPFAVQLTCSASTNVRITLNTGAPAPGLGGAGVIAPTAGAGFAKNVGVQLLDRNGNPVAFGTAINAGTATVGPFTIPFQARYYQTGAAVSVGNVQATATYTLTYQ